MTSPVATPADSLDNECRAARQLVELLKREQTQLINANINGLVPLMDDKAGLVAQMSSLATLRHRHLAAAGFSSDENGMQNWLRNQPAKMGVHQSWKELRSLAQSAKELNRINGLLIAKHLSRNQSAMNAININLNGGSFYGPDGQSRNKPGSRNLVIG